MSNASSEARSLGDNDSSADDLRFAMGGPRQAVVISHCPWPVDSGDPVRVLALTAVLADEEITDVLVVERPTTTEADREALRAHLGVARVSFFSSRWSRRGGPVWTLLRIARGILTGVPPWIVARHSADLDAYLRENGHDYARVVAIGEAAASYSAVGANWHWDKANVLTVSTREGSRRTSGLTKYRLLLDAWTSARFERRIGERVGTVSVTSREEVRRWGAVSSRALPVAVLNSAVPASPPVRLSKEPVVLAWLGSLAYIPNAVGLAKFLAVAGADLSEASATVRVIGGGLSKSLRSTLERYPQVELLGFVDDLASALDGTTVAVVPIWQGAGVKMKTLTLMAHGVPVVSTTTGAEGIDADAFVTVTDDPRSMVRACLDLSEAGSLEAAGLRGREVWQQDHSPTSFEASVRRCFYPGGSPTAGHPSDPAGSAGDG